MRKLITPWQATFRSIFLASVVLSTWSGCSTAPLTALVTPYPFTDSLPENTRLSIRDYHQKLKLPNGQEYGNSVRTLSLQGHSAKSLDETLKKIPCPRRDDVIRESKNNTPVLDKNKNTTPLWVWLCADGGVFRAKPMGDPMSKYRPQPHASKALRYPAHADYLKFADETVKIDNQGYAIPKWPTDLKSNDPQVITNWANQAHTDLARD